MSLLARWRHLAVSAAVLLADQTTKAWVEAHPGWGRDPLVLIPGVFEFVSWRNPGMMFSLLVEAPDPWRKIALTVLPLCAIALLLTLIARVRSEEIFSLAGFSLVLGGAVGNLSDRLLRGSVVDFIRVGIDRPPVAGWLDSVFGTPWWPAFNVADSAICLGATAIALELVLSIRRDRAAGPPNENGGRDRTAGAPKENGRRDRAAGPSIGDGRREDRAAGPANENDRRAGEV